MTVKVILPLAETAARREAALEAMFATPQKVSKKGGKESSQSE